MAPTATEGPNAAQSEYWHGSGGERWARLKAPHDAMLAPLTEKVFDAVGFAPGQRVLDLGCGTGTTTFEIAKRIAPTSSVTGIDFSETLLALAREQAAAEPDLPIAFESADVETRAFAPEIFDVAFSRFGVMFYADPARAFAGVHRAMVPGGRLECDRQVRLRRRLLAGEREQRLGKVDPRHRARRRNALGDLERRRTRAAAGVEHALARREAHGVEYLLGERRQHGIVRRLEVGPALAARPMPIFGLGGVGAFGSGRCHERRPLRVAYTTAGTRSAGGVLRLRPAATLPSITTMPTPGMSPKRTDSRRSLPDEC